MRSLKPCALLNRVKLNVIRGFGTNYAMKQVKISKSYLDASPSKIFCFGKSNVSAIVKAVSNKPACTRSVTVSAADNGGPAKKSGEKGQEKRAGEKAPSVGRAGLPHGGSATLKTALATRKRKTINKTWPKVLRHLYFPPKIAKFNPFSPRPPRLSHPRLNDATRRCTSRNQRTTTATTTTTTTTELKLPLRMMNMGPLANIRHIFRSRAFLSGIVGPSTLH